MTTPIPAGIQHFSPPLTPHPFGLYSVATPIDLDAPARLLGGVDWIPSNCGPSGIWEYGICPADPDPEDVKAGARPDHDNFPPATIWATDDCELYATDTAENEARAMQLLRLHEPVWAERHLAELIASRATPLPAADTVVDAVGALEDALGGHGFPGVLHARRGLAATAAAARLVAAQGAHLVTPLANSWLFGAGYTELGDTLYATGPLTVWRGVTSVRVAVDHTINRRQAVAERVVTVGWECPDVVYSVQVLSGGGS